MNTRICFAFVFLFLVTPKGTSQGTAFTYQGRLSASDTLTTGVYDFRFRLAEDSFGNAYAGDTWLSNGVPVNNGLFTVTLDFGTGIFNGSNYWLEIAVRTNGAGAFNVLNPLQPVTPTPYAIFAGGTSNLLGVVPNAAVSGIYSNAVAFNNVANSFSGAFAGDGSGLTNLNAQTLAGLSPAQLWRTDGNAGTTAGSNFLGTVDDQPLELAVNRVRALRLEPNTNGAPNVIGGSPVNFVDPGIVGATIAGGGTTSTNFFLGGGSNRVGAIFGTIGGGRQNTVMADHAFIGGGIANSIDLYAYDSVVGGGVDNVIQENAFRSLITGGSDNLIQSNLSYSAVGGGAGNRIGAGANAAVISGGYFNNIQSNANYATVAGGYLNSVTGPYGVIVGGDRNMATNNSFAAGRRAKALHPGSFVWGDATEQDVTSTAANQFVVRASGGVRLVTTGAGLSVDGQPVLIAQPVPNGPGITNLVNVVNGSSVNFVTNGVVGATISGGGAGYFFNAPFSNSVFGSFGTIGGGLNNTIGNGGWYSTIAGGGNNFASANNATVGGGTGNRSTGNASTVAGGNYNTASGDLSTVPGGQDNVAAGFNSFAAGNHAEANHNGAFVWADAQDATFASTGINQFLIRASGNVGINTASPGAALEVRTASPTGNAIRFGYVPGGAGNLIAGPNRVILATEDLVERVGISQSTGDIDLGGNVRIGTGAGDYRRLTLGGGNSEGFLYGSYPYFGDGVHVGYNFYADAAGNPHVINAGGGSSRISAGYGEVVLGVGNPGFGPNQVRLVANLSGVTVYGTFNNLSDRNAKQDFTHVNAPDILQKVAQLPITEWSYKEDPSTRHLGPVAQDFHAAFNIGTDDKHIAPIDEGGVALAAIQALNAAVKEKDARISALEKSVNELKELVARMGAGGEGHPAARP